MGLFKKSAPKKSVEVSCLELCGDGHCTVVGESHYQDALRATSRICTAGEEGRPTFTAVLVAEPHNQYDPNAIAIYSPAGHLGYLSRDDAVEYKEVLAEVRKRGYQAGACRAHLVGGTTEKPSFGVVLRLADPEACLDDMDA
jgi:HIRAN domain